MSTFYLRGKLFNKDRNNRQYTIGTALRDVEEHGVEEALGDAASVRGRAAPWALAMAERTGGERGREAAEERRRRSAVAGSLSLLDSVHVGLYRIV